MLFARKSVGSEIALWEGKRRRSTLSGHRALWIARGCDAACLHPLVRHPPSSGGVGGANRSDRRALRVDRIRAEA